MNTKTKKHQAVWNWFYECPHFQSLFFTFPEVDENGVVTDGQVSITPETVGNDEWLEEFADGSGIKQYVFSIAQYAPIAYLPNNTENIDTLGVFEQIVEWVEEQNKIGNFPVFPDNCTIEEIKAFPGQIAGQDETGAKFQFITQIKYYIESEDELWR